MTEPDEYRLENLAVEAIRERIDGTRLESYTPQEGAKRLGHLTDICRSRSSAADDVRLAWLQVAATALSVLEKLPDPGEKSHPPLFKG